jgi:translocation and assembly module TamB
MRRRRSVVWLARGLAVLLVSLVTLLAAVAVALQTSWAREQIRVQVNAALEPLFQGCIQIDRIGQVGLSGVSGVDARIFDPAGRQVIRVQGLRAVAWLPGLGWQLIAHGDAPELEILLAQVDHADVTLRDDAELGVTIASTFMPRETADEAEPSSGPGPTLRLRHIRFGRIWAHGTVAGSPALDADLLSLNASLVQSPVDGFELDLTRTELVSRALPLGADPAGTVNGSIEVPPDETRPMRMEAHLEGRAARSPLSLDLTWVGDELHGLVRLPRLPADFINQQSPSLALDGELTVEAEVEGELPELQYWAEIDGTAVHLSATGYAVLSGGLEAAASVAVARLDLGRIARDAPPSDLRLLANAVLFEDDAGGLRGAERIEIDRGRVAGEATPAAWLNGELSVSSASDVTLWGRVGADEPGAALLGDYRVALPADAPSSVTASLGAKLDEPERLASLGVHTAGAASVSLRLSPDTRALSGRAELSLRRLDYDRLQTRNVEVQARAAGTFDDPQLTAATTVELLSGRAHADLEYSTRNQKLSLFLADIDLKRLALSFGTQLPLETAALGLDATLQRSGRSAHYTLDGSAKVSLGKVGQAKLVATQLELSPSVPTLASLGSVRGDLSASGKLDLSQLSPLLTAAGVPLERTTGHVRFELTAKHSRDDDRGLELAAFLDSNGLRVVGERKSERPVRTTGEAVDNTPWALEGIDVHLAARSEPRAGTAVATLILRDHGGTLAETQVEAKIADLWPKGLVDMAAISRVPLRASLHVAERKLQSLPPLVRPAVLRGRVSVDVRVDGSVAQPRVAAAFVGRSLRAPGSRDPLDLDATLVGDAAGGKLLLAAKTTRGQVHVADVESEWRGDVRRATELARGEPVLHGSAWLKLSEFPLDVVPPLVDRQVQGRLSGDVKLLDWGKNARLDAKLHSSSLALANVAISDMQLGARTEGDRLLAEVVLKSGGGGAQASLDASMRWGRRPAPELGHSGIAKLSARRFRLETLSPLIGANVSEIGGILDAETRVEVGPAVTTVAGHAELERGVVQIPAIGQRFSDISARVVVGDNQFKLEGLVASGLTGKVTAKGAARLDGFALRSANAKVDIKEQEKLPLTLEGAAIGDAWGSVKVAYTSPERGERQLQIDVPEFHLITPETSGGGLQSLNEPESIRVGVRRTDGKFVPLPVQPLEAGGETSTTLGEPAPPLRIRVKLGSNVSVARGRTAQAQLTGQLTVLSDVTTEVTGRIEIRGGKLDVQGKNFEIERGVVTFDGQDPANPTITATARWDAPDYTVYAEYLGDVENGRIKLHSEPPLSQDEIASLLLFGTPDGSPGGSGNGDTAALAVSVAGDSAAKGLNQVLDDFTNLDVSARIDTTTGSARPELVVRLSPRVAAKVTRAVGEPAAGESPDRTFLTLELRLRRAWALSAVFGDRGASALDLIWRRRY